MSELDVILIIGGLNLGVLITLAFLALKDY